jgi:hypothetical protein
MGESCFRFEEDIEGLLLLTGMIGLSSLPILSVEVVKLPAKFRFRFESYWPRMDAIASPEFEYGLLYPIIALMF